MQPEKYQITITGLTVLRLFIFIAIFIFRHSIYCRRTYSELPRCLTRPFFSWFLCRNSTLSTANIYPQRNNFFDSCEREKKKEKWITSMPFTLRCNEWWRDGGWMADERGRKREDLRMEKARFHCSVTKSFASSCARRFRMFIFPAFAFCLLLFAESFLFGPSRYLNSLPTASPSSPHSSSINSYRFY